jgi:hypothetical protein
MGVFGGDVSAFNVYLIIYLIGTDISEQIALDVLL